MRGAFRLWRFVIVHDDIHRVSHITLFLLCIRRILYGYLADKQQNVKTTETNAQAAVARIVAGRDELKSQIQVRVFSLAFAVVSSYCFSDRDTRSPTSH